MNLNSQRGMTLILLFLLALLWSANAQTMGEKWTGMVTVPSSNNFETTVKKLEKSIERNPDIKLMLKLDHSENASSADLELRPTVLFIFGNPKAGTPLMQAGPTLGLDLPQKILVVQKDDGSVALYYNDPNYLAVRHDLSGQAKRLGKVGGLLNKLTLSAATSD